MRGAHDTPSGPPGWGESAPEPPAASPEATPGALSLVEVRRLWPDIVDATKVRRRVTWIHLTQNAQVVAVDARTLTLGFANSGARDSFDSNGSAEIVRQAAIDVVGTDWRIETIVDPGASPDAAPPPPAVVPPVATRIDPVAEAPVVQRSDPAQVAPAQVDQAPTDPARADRSGPSATDQAPGGSSGPGASPAVQHVAPEAPRVAVDDEPPPPWAVEPPADLDDEPEPGRPAAPPAPPTPADPAAIAAARGAIQQTRPAGAPTSDPGPDLAAADAEAHPDDEELDHDDTAGAELLARELGAKVIEEITHS